MQTILEYQQRQQNNAAKKILTDKRNPANDRDVFIEIKAILQRIEQIQKRFRENHIISLIAVRVCCFSRNSDV